jgi:2-hydroxy-6-oxonona-2,4-dienedioate hydrolase/4,5:9,10-diseco-3-hydroxy-5,9,17-trioxoandrosta-1(10),2-diene-4-oate hydrolase
MTAPERQAGEPTAETTSRYVQAGDVRIHYHEAGSGPVLLCIHGGAPGAFGWGNFGQNLPAFSRNFRTLIVDLPGYGKSDKPQVAGGRSTFYAETFRAMLSALGIERAHVLGMATGAAAAMKLAIDHPNVVDRLILVSAAGGLPLFTPSPSPGAKVISQYYQGGGPSREKMRAYLEMIMFDSGLVTEELVDERYRSSIDPDFMENSPEGRGRPPKSEPIWRDLDKIRAKTLVVWGRDNVVQGYDNSLFLLNQIPDAEVHLYSHTGLWVPYERRAEFERLVAMFLDVPCT